MLLSYTEQGRTKLNCDVYMFFVFVIYLRDILGIETLWDATISYSIVVIGLS